MHVQVHVSAVVVAVVGIIIAVKMDTILYVINKNSKHMKVDSLAEDANVIWNDTRN